MGKYEEAIVCIDLAIKNDYPTDKLKKINERKNNCINKLKDQPSTSSAGDEEQSKTKLIKKYAFAENCIEVDWLSSDLKELGIRSKRNLLKGEIILHEKPFVNSLHKENYNDYCYFCFKRLTFESQVPCRNCIQINYCCSDCETQSFDKFHKLECGYIDLYQINELLEHHTKICSKLICSLFVECDLNKEKMMNRIKQSTKKSGRKMEYNYESFAQLIQHQNHDKNNYSLISLLLIAFFNTRFKAECKSLFKSFFEESELIILKLTIERHIRQIQVNALMITETDIKPKSKINSEQSELEQFPIFESVNIGIGIFINLSLINHDCKPNLSISGFNNQSVLIKTNQNVNKQEWLCFSYGAHFNYQSVEKRKKLLWETYFFDCRCNACSKGIEPVSSAILCSNCRTEIMSSKQEYCHLCSNKIDRTQISKIKSEVNKKVNQIEKLLKDKQLSDELIGRFIIDLINCEKKVQPVLHPYNKCLEKVYFVLFACYKRLKNYQKLYESGLLYLQCLLIKLDYFDIMSFNNLLNFSNYLIKTIEEMISLDFSSKPIAILIQVKLNETIIKLKETLEQVYDYEVKKKNRILSIINKVESDLENFLGEPR